ncbi:MAG: hypothetical protein KKF68_01400 [Nanoarchaeota archaeon]|nr:hypothetical protein [Nanoarchaeota archaeon]
MENKKIILFLIGLILTFSIIRVSAIILHDFESYSSENPFDSKAKTITGELRRITGLDWHHIHFGIILISIVIPLIILNLHPFVWLIFGSGLSMILDQFFPLINLGNYFGAPMFLISILLHLIAIETSLIISLEN